MKRKKILDIILREKIIAIVRLKEQRQVSGLLQSLISGGIKVLEITANTPGFLAEIAAARSLYPEVLIGAGTITNAAVAEKAILAGAQFLVTPNTNVAVISIAHQQDVPVIMGALTPTEICLAAENGADLVKLFPAETLGLNYFKAVQGPLNQVLFFAVGGIDLSNVQDWMKAGAAGVGLGSVLTRDGMDQETIKNRAQQFVTLINAG